MGEEPSDEIDPETYVGVELIINESVVNIKTKRLMLLSEKDKFSKNEKVKSRSRSRSNEKCSRDKKK
jgi:hypothetical protein